MKKLCLMIVALAAVLSFTACKRTTDTEQQTESIADIQLTNCVHHVQYFSNDAIDYFNSLLKNGKWEEGLIKMSGDYIFMLRNGDTISYASDLGAINDEANNRYLLLTDEQKSTLNEFLKP